MNGIVTAHRVLNGKIQTVMATINNCAISWIRNSIPNVIKGYLNSIKPSTVTDDIYFQIDKELVTESPKSNHSPQKPYRVYFTATVQDDVLARADTYFLYADIDDATDPEISGYKQMNQAFKDAQYRGVYVVGSEAITAKELNDPSVFVDTMILKL